MIRRILIVASALSLLLFLGTAALWVRSQFRSDLIYYTDSYLGDGTKAQRSEESITARRPRWANGIWWDERNAFTDRGGIVLFHERGDAPGVVGGMPKSGWGYAAEAADERQVRFWPSY